MAVKKVSDIDMDVVQLGNHAIIIVIHTVCTLDVNVFEYIYTERGNRIEN